MGCCGRRREALRPQAPGLPTLGALGGTPPAAGAGAVRIAYRERTPIRVTGAATGRFYLFGPGRMVQAVDPRDAPALLRTRFFTAR